MDQKVFRVSWGETAAELLLEARPRRLRARPPPLCPSDWRGMEGSNNSSSDSYNTWIGEFESEGFFFHIGTWS
jgi:hypothetical protein